MSMARIIKWDVDPTGAFDRTLSPKEIMNKLEQRDHACWEQTA